MQHTEKAKQTNKNQFQTNLLYLLGHFLKFRIFLDAHTAKVFVFEVFERLPSCSSSWKHGVSQSGTTSAPKAVHKSPKRPQQAPTRLSVLSGSCAIAPINLMICSTWGCTNCISAGKHKIIFTFKLVQQLLDKKSLSSTNSPMNLSYTFESITEIQFQS